MNQDIRQKIRDAGLKQWEVAKQYGVSEYTFIRWLRDELSEERKSDILSAVEAISRRGV